MLETTERTKDFKGLRLDLQRFADDGEGTSESPANEKGEEKGNEGAEVKTFTEEEVQARIQSESDKRVTEALKTARAKWEKEEAEAKKEAERLQSLSQKEREEELKAKQLKELEETKAELERVYLERDTIDRLAEENVKVNIFQKPLDICYSNVIQYKCKANAYNSKEFINVAKGNWYVIYHLAHGFPKECKFEKAILCNLFDCIQEGRGRRIFR